MLRIQFDGFTIEIGRDRSASSLAFMQALPYLVQLMRSKGLQPLADFFGGTTAADMPDPN